MNNACGREGERERPRLSASNSPNGIRVNQCSTENGQQLVSNRRREKINGERHLANVSINGFASIGCPSCATRPDQITAKQPAEHKSCDFIYCNFAEKALRGALQGISTASLASFAVLSAIINRAGISSCSIYLQYGCVYRMSPLFYQLSLSPLFVCFAVSPLAREAIRHKMIVTTHFASSFFIIDAINGIKSTGKRGKRRRKFQSMHSSLQL